MYGFMVAVHVLACIFLIAVILFQAGRGGGLSETFGSSAMQNIFGSSSKTILTKITAVCAVIFIITSLLLTILTTRRSKSLIDLEKGRVMDIVASQKSSPVSKQELPLTAGKDAAKTVTIKEVKIDPATGKEIVVKEEKMTPQEAAARQKQQQNAPTVPVVDTSAQPVTQAK